MSLVYTITENKTCISMGLFSFFKKRKVERSESVQPEHIDSLSEKIQQDFINESISTAELLVSAFNDKYDGAFDYSERSLGDLDELLENFAEFKDKMDDGMKEDLISQAGAYIFEVARRNYGGKYFWNEQNNQPVFVTGTPIFEIALLAFDKVRKRIENGSDDSIPFFFKGYSERVRNAKPGDKALII